MFRRQNGQVLVLFSLALVVLVGAIALGTDVAIFYVNWMRLQKAADAAALAGANYLPDNPSNAESIASQFAQSNGIKVSEIQSTSVSSNDLSITINLQRNVPYILAKVLGMTSGLVSVSATASPQTAPTTVNASMTSQVPSGGDNNGANGSTCASVGACGLIPIGLDSHTTYYNHTQIDLQQGQLGPGNWDLLALGGTGGNNLRTNIANGYNSIVSVGDWVSTEPGKKVGPVDQGFQDRLDAAASNTAFLSDSCTGNYNPIDPRVMILPVVDWQHPNGRSAVLVTSFAPVWLVAYQQGQVTVCMLSTVIPNSFAASSATSFGGHGDPTLIK